jgi:hypothetical protein
VEMRLLATNRSSLQTAVVTPIFNRFGVDESGASVFVGECVCECVCESE